MRALSITLALFASQALSSPSQLLTRNDISFENNFATEILNKRTPPVDLGPYGDPSGMLPRVYNIALGHAIYNATASYTHYKNTLDGTGPNLQLRSEIAARRALRKRQTQMMDFSVAGPGGNNRTYTDYSCGPDPGAPCETPFASDAFVSEVVVTQVDNCHFRFLQDSGSCTGGNDRFAPSCNQVSEQRCEFNTANRYRAFVVFDRCEDSSPICQA